MTTNFKLLADYTIKKNHTEIFNKIETIESKIIRGDFEYIFMEGRKILELLMLNYYEEYKNLEEVLQDFSRMNLLPSNVKNALFQIKAKGNESVHISQQNKEYVFKADIFSSVELLKHLFALTKYFVSREYGMDFDKSQYHFDSSFYLGKIENEYQTTMEVAPNTETLESRLKGIFELISSDYNFLIPTYQRNYTWTPENVEIFLQDIVDRSNDKQIHYMGSLAIAVDVENKLLRLIDGQQRITTSLILLKVIHERYSESKVLKVPVELEKLNKVIEKKYRNNTGQYGDLNYVKNVLSGNITTDKTFLNSSAYINYQTIKKFIKQLLHSELDQFYTTFVYQFVISELRFKNELGQEIQIFENLNSKGMELSQWDLIKNYIYKKVHLDLLIEKDLEIEQMIKRLFIIKSSYSFGQKNNYKYLSEFFVFYSRIKSMTIFNKKLNDKGKVHKIFAKMWPMDNIDKFTTIPDLRKSLVDISRYFDIYCQLQSKEYLNPSSPLFFMRLHLENLSVKNAHFGLIIQLIHEIAIWDDHKLDHIDIKGIDEINVFVSDIDKYITRLIVSNNTGQSLPQFFDSFISIDIKTSHALFLAGISKTGLGTSLVPWKTFNKDLHNKNDWQSAYALSVLRTFVWDQNSKISKRYQITLKPSLEHIFPQKPNLDSEWFKGEMTSISRYKEKHESRINKLGNYLILSQSMNSKASNKPFLEKLVLYKKLSDDKLFKGTDGSELMDLQIKNSFTLEDINERTKQLAALIAPLYKLSNEK